MARNIWNTGYAIKATLHNPTIVNQKPATVTAATLTITPRLHSSRTLVLNGTAGAGTAITLPAATGTGDRYRFIVGVASNANTIASAPTTDYFVGGLFINDVGDSSAATADFFPTASTSNKISPTTAGGGGNVGSFIELEDYATGLWRVSGTLGAATDPVNPFSHV